jgi:hypothetical protein
MGCASRDGHGTDLSTGEDVTQVLVVVESRSAEGIEA